MSTHRTAAPDSQRRTIVLLAILVVLVASAAYFLLWKPQSEQLATADDDRRQAEEALVAARSTPPGDAPLGEVNAAGATLVESSEPDPVVMQSAVPSSPELTALIRSLQATADNSGTTVRSLAVTPFGAIDAASDGSDEAATEATGDTTTSTGTGTSGTITLTAVGTREAIRSYLRALAALPRLVVVEQVSVQKAAAEAAVDEVQVDLTAKVFAATTE